MWNLFLLISFPFQHPLKVEYISLRPAKWEETVLTEEINEKRNLGGLAFIYYKNISDRPVSLREWYLNHRESGHYRLSGDVAWDRRYLETLAPGETTVQEICGVSEDFQIGKPANFSIINQNWQTILRDSGTFKDEKFRISSIVFDTSLSSATIHIRSLIPTKAKILSVSVENRRVDKIDLSAAYLEEYGHVVGHLSWHHAFTAGALCLIRVEAEVDGKKEVFYSHRNAYPDFFPNGTWSIYPMQYSDAQKHHLNTMVKGGTSKDAYFAREFQEQKFKTMTHTGLYPNIDMIRDLKSHPSVACWYIHDEPDWLHHPQVVYTANSITKAYSLEKPTMITLCRNVKFFEYAFIPDIPCQDHYSVTAPTSSKWPFVYGTKLEETGFYTRDLKYASEPKPIWVWTQGVHLWDERPKMPLPTPDELGAQLFFNLGQGAKGNLWFTFQQEAGTRFPKTKQALQDYSRLIRLIEKDLQVSDPFHTETKGPEKLDIAPLISKEQLTIFLTNLDYQIHDSAYIWKPKEKVSFQLRLPVWFEVKDGFEWQVTSGLKDLNWSVKEQTLNIALDELNMGSVLILSSDADRRKEYQARNHDLILVETKSP